MFIRNAVFMDRIDDTCIVAGQRAQPGDRWPRQQSPLHQVPVLELAAAWP